MIIAAGVRQVHEDIHGKKFVLFDGGIYALPSGATTSKEGDGTWVDCEANADEISGKAYVTIGGVEMDYVFTPNSPIAKKGDGVSKEKSEEVTEEAYNMLMHIIQNEAHRLKTIKRRR